MTPSALLDKQPHSQRLKILANPDFMKVLRSRVNNTLGTTNQRATFGLWFRGTLILMWFAFSYLGLFFIKSAPLQLLLCFSLGLATACVGFNIFHDSIHAAFSYRKWINRSLAFLSCSIAGPSHFIWRHKHNYLHHQFPNIQDWDDDLETRGGLRLSPLQKWSERYRYQHIYAPFIYALTTMEWVFVRDFIRYFSTRMNETQSLPKMSPADHIEFWISKVIYFALTVVIPLCYFTAPQYIAGFLVVHLVASVVLAVVFQLAHVMSESQFPSADPESGKINLNWAQLQLATTVNFAPKSHLLSWYCGGLNFQIEHHLLPGVCHAHYKKISPIVEATALEFGYPYNTVSSHWGALADHFGMLKRLSRPETIPTQRG